MNTMRNNVGVAFLFLAAVLVFGQLTYAREGAALGVFFDLPGSLTDSGVMPMTRLVLGDGFTVAHLDILFGLPTGPIPNPGLRFLPYFVLNFPIKFSDIAILTPYAGLAPVLFTAGALAAPPIADWIFKFGTSFTFGGFGFFAETGFFMPIAALPTFSVGFMIDFPSINSLLCDTCIDESYY